jgi:autotransporter-associated beta strand protein
MIDGGPGTWDNPATNPTTNWTNASGMINSRWQNFSVAVFAGNAGGTVSVTDPIVVNGLDFTTNGYEIAATNDGHLELNGQVTINITDINVTATISAPLTDYFSEIQFPGGIIKDGEGTLVLSGANTYTGGTTINGGTLSISSDANLGAATVPGPSPSPIGQLTFDGGTLRATAGFALNANRGMTLLAGGGTIAVTDANVLSYGGVITGNGSLTKTGTGTLTLSGVNTYTGATAVNGGTLSISSDANLGTAPAGAAVAGQLTINGGTLRATASFALNANRGMTLLAGGGTIGVTDANVLSYGGVITGSGSLTKTDTGTLTLSGVNTYTGATSVNGGTLRAGVANTLFSQTALTLLTGATFDLNSFAQSIGSLAGAGSVTLGTATLTTGNDNTSTLFSGILSSGGAGPGGSLTKVGTGTLTLSGVNTYTGATAVNAGTLLVDGALAASSAVRVNSGGTLGGTGRAAGAVTIANGGILAPGDGGAGTLTFGSLSLSNGSLLNYELGRPGVIGSGFSDLTSVTGNLTLDGILNATALASFGPGAYRLFNYGGALTDNMLDIGTVPIGFIASNFIIVTGLPNEVDLLVLAGTGAPAVQFWDGPNIAANGVIDGGTGNWGNFTTNWTNASGAANSSWLDGVSVFAGNAGTVSVAEPIYFAGMEFMTNGYQINATTFGSLQLIGSPTITTDMNVTATIGAPLGGVGGITKMGSGTLILSGLNAYTGPTTVNFGSLLVDGSIGAGQTSVNAGGFLGGRGMIGGSVLNSGIVSPGNTLGTLRINNNYTQSAGGTLRIEIAGLSSGQHDLLTIGGTANLAGTLQIVPLNGFSLSAGDQVTFLTAANGVTGTFDTIQNGFSSTGTLVGNRIVVLSNSVVLEGTQGSFAEFGRVVCQIPNHAAVGAGLDSVVDDSRASDLIEYLNNEPLVKLCHDLDLISPEEFAAIFSIGVSLANVQTANLERRMDDLRAGSSGFSASGLSINSRGRDFNEGIAGPTGPEGKSGPPVNPTRPDLRWGSFVTGVGEFTSVDGTNNAPGYDLSTGGLTLGVDYRLSPNFAIGLTAGYANTGADLTDNGHLDVDGAKFGVYATAFSGGFYVNAAATGGFNDYEIHRTALVGTAIGDTQGRDFNGLVAAGYDWKKGGLTIGPTASFQYTYVEVDGFTEQGSLAPLTFADQDANSNRTALGFKASYDWQVGHVLVKPELRAAWQHEFGDPDYSVTARFASGAGNAFTVNSPAIGRDSALVGAGFAVLFNDRISAYAYYDGELLRSNYVSHNVSAGVRVNF